MFVACQSCSWAQDHFWNDEYHPFKNDTFSAIKGIFELAINDPKVRSITPRINGQNIEAIDIFLHTACELQYIAETITHMYWYTYKDYEKDPDKKCPNCGRKELLLEQEDPE